ncbi:MAG TPA: tetratricopeptide repeat protein [Bryobacteraceae bacterium]|nr:tetratricopeptide repeat protein [Bryobacteraceae bacterium]
MPSRILSFLLVLTAARAAEQGIKEYIEQGEQALARGDLAAADASFRHVLAINPNEVGAHVNLGVIAMRRKKWQSALSELTAAEKLAPQVPGIRLNIGLVHFRQYDFRGAIRPLESVVRDTPDSVQAHHLLGLCYFFTDRHADAVKALEPIWGQESEKLDYLYVVAIAAEKSGNSDLQKRALQHMLDVGKDSAELHMFVGKGYLQEQDDERAIAELERAAAIDPKLPFVHYFLGVAYRRRHDLERAKTEFLKDAVIEPDVAFDYDQLGAVCSDLQANAEATRYFHEALRRDSHMASSQFGLAKIYREQGKFTEALAALDAAGKLDTASASVHYLRGQILVRLGRRAEGRTEFETAAHMRQAETDKIEREVSGQSFLDPQLTADPK